MLKQRVVIGALAAMLVLSVSASALVVNDTQTWNTRFGVQTLSNGTLEIGPSGNLTINARVDMDGVSTNPVVPSKIIMNGGILDINGSDGLKFPDNSGRVEIWLNSGTMTASGIELVIDSNRDPWIYVGGASLTVEKGYLGVPVLTNPERWDAAAWLAAGRIVAQDGYVLNAMEDLGSGAVKITATPTKPNTPAPADGSTVSDLNLANLCWKNYGFTSAKVYFGAADANEVNYLSKLTLLGTTGTLPTNGTQVCYSRSGTLASGTLYSWAVEQAGVAEPNVVVWQFYATAAPQVVSSPANQSVFAGETAVFTAVFSSPLTPVTAQWSKNGSPAGAGVVTSLGSNQYQVTLTITNVTTANEGAYTCVATNSGGSSFPTASGYLTVKRTLANWTFDNTLNDTTGVYNTTATKTPSYVQGVVPGRTALDFADPGAGNLGQVLSVPAGFANFRPGLTVSLWMNMDAASDVSARIFALEGTGLPGILVRRVTAGGDLRISTGGGTEYVVNGAVTTGQWQHIVATVSDAGAFNIYINGQNRYSGTSILPSLGTRNANLIGGGKTTSRDDQFIGLIDDIKVRNYAISYEDVLDDYHGVVGGYTCKQTLAYDLNNDCQVNLIDIQLMASLWLECGRYPASECK